MARGKLIVLEGIDGSGKRTQMELLLRELTARGQNPFAMSFPRYESFFGKLVGRYLNGEFGTLREVNPHFAAMLYAGDRFQAKSVIEEALAAGKTVVCDRYIASNLAHQTGRVADGEREEFLAWIKHIEYGLYGMPVEDLVIYLRVVPAEAHRLIAQKPEREYTTSRRDLQEADLHHLEQAAGVYDSLATASNWARIECSNSSDHIRSPEEIHREVMAAVESRILKPAAEAQAKTAS